MRNTMIVLAGLPASGKSAVAVRLNKALDSVLLDKDRVRDFFFQEQVDYSNEQNDLCVEMMYQVASYLLLKDEAPIVIIDGRSYSRKVQIERLKAVVAQVRCNLIIVECICSPASARQRLERDYGVHLAKDRDYALYSRSKAAADQIDEPRLVLDTDKLSADECALRALSYVAEFQ